MGTVIVNKGIICDNCEGIEDDWYVGRLMEVPEIFSQWETLEELQENIKGTYQLIIEDEVLLIHTGF